MSVIPIERSRARRMRDAARRLGIRALRPEQKSVIQAVLDRRDALVVLPTGFGKSACYQVPSFFLKSPVVVISPLLALLKDQAGKLERAGVPHVRIDSTVRGRASEEAFRRLRQGGRLIVLTTPETFCSQALQEVVQVSGTGLIAVDEAHCVSEWGHDFRPSYLRLEGAIRSAGRPPVLALTATATPHVRQDIQVALDLIEPTLVVAPPERRNLSFAARLIRGDERVRALGRLIRKLPRPAIIYCATTRRADELYLALRKARLPVHRYHGKMPASRRAAEQEFFMKPGRRSIIVATSAFGLGIDKPDIRSIIHAQAPASLEQYVQEAGRAGRDGKPSRCVLLFDPADREIHEALQERSRIRPEQLFRLARVLPAWSGEGKIPSIEGLALSAGIGPRTVVALLSALEDAGLLEVHGEQVLFSIPAEELERRARSLAGKFDTLRIQDSRRLDSVAEYARTELCRAVFLRTYFGEEHGHPCGVCDRCREAAGRPSLRITA